jgi:hypothetical protein
VKLELAKRHHMQTSHGYRRVVAWRENLHAVTVCFEQADAPALTAIGSRTPSCTVHARPCGTIS